MTPEEKLFTATSKELGETAVAMATTQTVCFSGIITIDQLVPTNEQIILGKKYTIEHITIDI